MCAALGAAMPLTAMATSFEPSRLTLHAFQVMLPFGTMSPVMSVKLARAVYVTNDERAAIKKRINNALGSTIVEEKSYKAY